MHFSMHLKRNSLKMYQCKKYFTQKLQRKIKLPFMPNMLFCKNCGFSKQLNKRFFSMSSHNWRTLWLILIKSCTGDPCTNLLKVKFVHPFVCDLVSATKLSDRFISSLIGRLSLKVVRQFWFSTILTHNMV
jgi:hypothetical protein